LMDSQRPKDWKEKLKRFGEMRSFEQAKYKQEILECWDELLRSLDDISREEFAELLQGVVFFPEMIYDCLCRTQPQKGRKKV